ncbi:MAG: histidinol-phosphate transaminase [Sphingobacteriales bacterium]|nr:MAG: histidinol-phosphate transaminase [Sphingobacteriales bacterium]
MNNLIRPNIRNLQAYSSARSEFEGNTSVALDANENPFGNGVNRYPDPLQRALKARIGQLKGVGPAELLIGNGSDGIIDLLMRCCCVPGTDEIIITPPTYGMYAVLAQINDVRCTAVPLNTDFSLNVDAILASVNPNTKMIILCSPNNPTGNLLAVEDIGMILNHFNGIVLLDEAYVDFSPDASWVPRRKDFPNLVVCQTLSKAWGMAGLRLGIAIADPEWIAVLNSMKPPYNVNQLSQERSLALLEDESLFRERLDYLLCERKRLLTKLQELDIVLVVFPSDANFLLVKFEKPDVVYRCLSEQGIIVRNRSREPLCEGCLRITVGLQSENDALLNALQNMKP